MEIELVSFKLCPFVQRSLITLIHRDIPYLISYIDLADPPAWFTEISPFGQVPVLKVDRDTVLFESAVINEFIDEASPGSMQPDEPLRRALNRAWTEFGSACLMDNHKMISAVGQEGFEQARAALRAKFSRLEQVLERKPFFNGERLSLIDTSYAPLFMRLEILRGVCEVYSVEEFPRITSWSKELLAIPAVQSSVVDGFYELYRGYVRSKQGYLATLLD
ncbi:MAG: glutathione S-transferase family protein [Gammaproteobacteria bacterium]|nr:glutathione S-transferase family protein [Gammaproteobacteria bacterium]